MKIKKIFFNPIVLIQPCRPKSDSAPPGAIWAQFRPKQPNQEAIPAHAEVHFSAMGPNQPYVIGLYWLWFKGAKLDLPKRPHF